MASIMMVQLFRLLLLLFPLSLFPLLLAAVSPLEVEGFIASTTTRRTFSAGTSTTTQLQQRRRRNRNNNRSRHHSFSGENNDKIDDDGGDDDDLDKKSNSNKKYNKNNNLSLPLSRRKLFLSSSQKAAAIAGIVTGITSSSNNIIGLQTADNFIANAITTDSTAVSSEVAGASAIVTDKVYVDVAGLTGSIDSAEISKTQRIVFGLFGNDAPDSVKKLKQLFDTKQGLVAPCKPLKTDYLIQREQLEANKVYRSCTETVDKQNVNYEYSQIWRIVKNERIDFGSVTGKYIAREFPTWAEKKQQQDSSLGRMNDYLSDSKYIMAVRRGNDSGFGFTVFVKYSNDLLTNDDFVQNYIVVGKALDDETSSSSKVLDQINDVNVVNSAKQINYMGIVGGGNKAGSGKNAPDKSCRYGGPMYCNENKPLTKLTLQRTGIL